MDDGVGDGLLVVIGSSAGGIEALSVVLSGLPPNFRAPIVIAQHLDPARPSSLATILTKTTRLRVLGIETDARLEAATAYVVPSNCHVEVSDGSVHLRVDGNGRPKPSIDLLFTTSAAAFRERLIAVVLTGMGHDGSAGARAVKRSGGTVIAEDPATASFPSMPGSVDPELVDVVAPLSQIADELVRLVDDSIDLNADGPALSELLERIRTSTGIDFSHYKVATIKRRLARQMALAGTRSVGEYLARITHDDAEFERLASSFLIKVTDFFRDRELFDALRAKIVPELIATASARGGRELRVWSAGCATGEEAYSIAIVIAEALREEAGAVSVRIFATDVDETAIEFARRAVYSHESLAKVDPVLVERYFVQTEAGWEIAKTIRNMTVFGQHDLARRAPFPRIDLALCRNVLIYFSSELQSRTLQVFAFSLRDGGYLALGKSETTNPLPHYFAVVDPALRLFRRYGERVPIPSAQDHLPLLRMREAERPHEPFPALELGRRDSRPSINEKLGNFLTNSSIGVVLVDRHYDIVSINASARAMFNLHGIAIGEDLVHLSPPNTSLTLRAMLDSALRNQQPTAGGEEIEVQLDGADASRFLSISCYPEIAASSPAVGAVILAVDVTDIAKARRASLQALHDRATELEQLRATERHLRERQRSLIEANAQLANANAELRMQNDALVISAEEAAAATEESETLNEEMQATNEELETLNEEFQSTIEELNTTNDEHEARGRDLADELEAQAAERERDTRTAAAFAAIADTLPAAVAAVDATGAVLAANARFRAIEAGALDTSVQIDDESGATIPLRVVMRRAGEGHGFAFTYRSIAADQDVSTYAGRVHPVAGDGSVRAIIELSATS
jgi:two-component system CheB/CheR fusion protein